MPPARKGIDGLWNCLRPAFSFSSPPNTRRIFKSLRTSTTRGANPLQCPNQAKRRIFLQTRSYHRMTVDTKERLSPSQLGNVDTLYRELYRQGIRADFLKVYEIVGELVGRHGEAPNARLFLALILANTSSQHGSTTEVMRLLQEMADDGIEPDSATYHAVLKVDVENLWSRNGHLQFRSGSRHTSGLPHA